MLLSYSSTLKSISHKIDYIQIPVSCRHLHFPKLNNVCHFSYNLANLSRSFCKCCLSPPVLTFLNTFVSSTNISMLLVILSSKSLIYIKNNKGHNTDPCGTPLKCAHVGYNEGRNNLNFSQQWDISYNTYILAVVIVT